MNVHVNLTPLAPFDVAARAAVQARQDRGTYFDDDPARARWSLALFHEHWPDDAHAPHELELHPMRWCHLTAQSERTAVRARSVCVSLLDGLVWSLLARSAPEPVDLGACETCERIAAGRDLDPHRDLATARRFQSFYAAIVARVRRGSDGHRWYRPSNSTDKTLAREAWRRGRLVRRREGGGAYEYALACCGGSGRTRSSVAELFARWATKRETDTAESNDHASARVNLGSNAERGEIVHEYRIARGDYARAIWRESGERSLAPVLGLHADAMMARGEPLGTLLALALAESPVTRSEAEGLALTLLDAEGRP